MKKLPGRLIVTNPHGGDRKDYVNVQITDAISSTILVNVKLSLEQFGIALSSSREVKCDLEYYPESIGKVQESKTEEVFVPKGEWKDRYKTAEEAVSKFEVDGWKGSVSDATNSKRNIEYGDKGTIQKVSFYRYVDRNIEDIS